MADNHWFSAEASTFGDRLAGAREAAGLSAEDLARQLGVKLKTIQGWEDDAIEPRANKLQMLCGMLNVSIRWILTGEGDGLDGPGVASAPLSGDMRAALADLARMRAQTLALASDMGQLEKRIRALMREDVQ